MKWSSGWLVVVHRLFIGTNIGLGAIINKRCLFLGLVILNNQLKPEDVPDLLQHKYTNRGTRKAMHHPPLILIGVAPGDLLLEQLFGVVV